VYKVRIQNVQEELLTPKTNNVHDHNDNEEKKKKKKKKKKTDMLLVLRTQIISRYYFLRVIDQLFLKFLDIFY
jgi:hypothetical protein